MVAKRHKITNVPLFKKLWDIIFFFWDNNLLSHFLGHFEGASTFLTPKLAPSKCPSKWLKKLLSRKKKIMSRSFLNSGTLIVILSSVKICKALQKESKSSSRWFQLQHLSFIVNQPFKMQKKVVPFFICDARMGQLSVCEGLAELWLKKRQESGRISL